MDFRLLGEIGEIETIAANLSIRERSSLKVRFGGRRWRKLKGVALVRSGRGCRNGDPATGTKRGNRRPRAGDG
jgi:hypothetical protein